MLVASAEAIPARLRPTEDEFQAAHDELEAAYTEYVTSVSVPEHAMSLRAAAFLLCVCRRTKARRVCDLGSGFSSYVLALYAQQAGHRVDVHSVDHDQAWLARTETFLVNHGVRSWVRLWEWPAFHAEDHAWFDVIFHDLAGGDVREDAMPWVCANLASNGVAIFDDMHHYGHCTAMLAAAADFELATYSLHQWTLDTEWRFGMMAVDEAGGDELSLAARYEQACRTPSDIHEHLPMFVELVDQIDARHVLELGTRSGISTIAWLYALDGRGTLTSVDLSERPDIGDYDHWTFIQGDDEDPAIVRQVSTPTPDIIFLDTSHHWQHTRRELATYRWVVRPGGLIVCHDTEVARPEHAPIGDPAFPVRKAIEEFCEVNGFTWVNVTGCNGLGIVKVG